MISQSLFLKIRCLVGAHVLDPGVDQDVELHRFIKPYVLVIHQPTGRGFYLDRGYWHIIDIDCCQEPESAAETERHHLCPSTNHPAWIESIDDLEFDTFWLY